MLPDHLFPSFQQGDNQTFTLIFNELFPRLCVCVNNFIRDHGRSEDTAIDILVKVWQKKETFNDFNHVVGFSIISAKRLAMSLANKKENVKLIGRVANVNEIDTDLTEYHREEVFVDNHTKLNSMIEKEKSNTLIEAMGSLPDKCRRVFYLHMVRGHRLTTVAKMLSVSPDTARNHKVYGLKLLRERISKQSVY